MYYSGFYNPFHFFSGFLGWLLVFLAIYWVIKMARGGDSGLKGGRDHAMDILREKYARGEINKEEFEAKKKDLS